MLASWFILQPSRHTASTKSTNGVLTGGVLHGQLSEQLLTPSFLAPGLPLPPHPCFCNKSGGFGTTGKAERSKHRLKTFGCSEALQAWATQLADPHLLMLN